MSELRQRRGQTAEGGEGTVAARPEMSDTDKKRILGEIHEMFTKQNEKPKPGLTNVAKAAKDKLAVYPYDMDAIFDLGEAYYVDRKYKECANVMVRGWKRTKEFKESEKRYEFLYILTLASLHLKKYRQAEAVLRDIEEPPADAEDKASFDLVKCQVYCFVGQEQQGLKAFVSAIESYTDFDKKCGAFAMCYEALKKGAMLEIAKDKIRTFAEKEEDKAKLDSIAALAEIKLQHYPGEVKAATSTRVLAGAVAMVLLLIIFYVLYQLEQRSLSRMQMIK